MYGVCCLLIACIEFVLAGVHLAQGNAVWVFCLLSMAVSNIAVAVIYERRYREESAKESVVVIDLKGRKDEQVQND